MKKTVGTVPEFRGLQRGSLVSARALSGREAQAGTRHCNVLLNGRRVSGCGDQAVLQRGLSVPRGEGGGVSCVLPHGSARRKLCLCACRV